MLTSQVINFWNDVESLEITEKSSIFVRILKNVTQVAFNYFTFWILLFHLLYYAGIARKYQASLLLLSFIVSFNGFIIIYYYPRKFNIPYFNISASGAGVYNTYLADFIFHQVPLIFLLMNFDNRIKNDSLILGVILASIYIITQNINKVYNLQCSDCKKAHRDNLQSIKRCVLACGLFNLEVIALMIFLLIILVKTLFER